MRGAIAFIWAWVCSAVGFREQAAPDRPAIEPARNDCADQPTEMRGRKSDAAQLEDHGRSAARRSLEHQTDVAQPGELTPGAARLLGGPRIDGGTSWTIRAGPLGFACWRELTGAARLNRGSVSWPDPWGEVVTLALDRGAPGSGCYVLATGRVRIEIRRRWAEVQITAEAAEVEGVESWHLREMPRAVLWLLGVQLKDWIDPDRSHLIEELQGIGVEQRRIELCLDVAGWQLQAGDERAMVSRATIHPHWRSEDTLNGVDAGQRHSTPNSIGVYDKVAKLLTQRGPERAALLERWREHGWRSWGGEQGSEGEPVTRVELRLWGAALQLVSDDGQQLDATHPGAALDAELLGKLWADGLTKHRMVNLAGEAKRLRDRPELEVWTRARAAGGCVEAVRLRRDIAARQLDATRRHALERLGRVGAEVEVLLEGDGSGAELLDALDELIAAERWGNDIERARARFSDLLEQGGAS